MTKNNFFWRAGQVITAPAGSLLYFPVWWYGQGFWKLLVFLRSFLSDRQQGLALFVWIKNIFTPMYGQRDFAGALISFLMRIFQIIFRSLVLLLWLIFCLALAMAWLVIPLYLVFQIFWQLNIINA